MSEILEELRYTESHEWVREEDDGTLTVGITDHAQQLLGDLVFVELPEVGQEVKSNEECAVVESVKAASDVYSPISGEIIAVNSLLVDEPERVNQSPYEDGWLFKIQPIEGDDSWKHLLTADQYAEIAQDE